MSFNLINSIFLLPLLYKTGTDTEETTTVKDRIYHVLNVNTFHNRIKTCIRRFQGSSNQCLDSYLNWFRWLEIDKHLTFEKQVKQMLILARQK